MVIRCFTCGRMFQMSHGKYHGKTIPAYRISVCNTCYDSNWDGWTDGQADQIEDHLRKNSLPVPERTSENWLPRDGKR